MRNDIDQTSFLSNLMWALSASSAGAFVTLLARLRDPKKRQAGFVVLLIESGFCAAFGTVAGMVIMLITEQLTFTIVGSSLGGMFAEKLYKRLEAKADKINANDIMNPANLLNDEDEDGNDSTKKKVDVLDNVEVPAKKNHKVFVGIGLANVDANAYQGWDGKLNSPLKDLSQAKAWADKFGYDEQFLFANESATANNIVDTLVSLRDRLDGGGELFFYYSGHGAQFREYNKKIETLCLFDQQMIETELRKLLEALNARIVAIFDCCHSGGLSKKLIPTEGGNFGVLLPKSMPIETVVKQCWADVFRAQWQRKEIGRSPKKAEIKYLTACSKNEVAYDGTENGLFTGVLKNILSENANNLDYSSLMLRANEALQGYQTPQLINSSNSSFHNENNFLEHAL